MAGEARSAAKAWWALAGLTLAVLAVSLDGTVLSVALPTLARGLHASESDLEWFQSGYLLVLAAAMLPVGLLGDRLGRRRVLVAALVLFGIGSIACAEAPSPGAFIAARAVLGIAGAGIIVMALSVLTVVFTAEQRPKAVGVWAAANFLALPIGPLFGGWLLTHFWWGWAFLVNVPVTLVGVAAVATLIPESRAAERPGLDVVGTVLSAAGLLAVTYGLVRAGEDGWGDAGSLGWLLAGVLTVMLFVAWERRVGREGGHALVDVALFRAASFTWGVLLAGVGALAMVGVLFTMPQFFQAVLGTSPMGSGLRLIPLVVGLLVGAVPADKIAARLGVKAAVAAGFVMLAAGLALGALTSRGSSAGFVAAWMALAGAGMGLSLSTATSTALSEVGDDGSGVAAGVLQALQKLGGPFGAAILGSLASSAYRARLHLGDLPAGAAAQARASVFDGVGVARRAGSPRLLSMVESAFTHGMDYALRASAGIAVLGVVLAIVFLPKRTASATTKRNAGKERHHVGLG